MIKNRSLFIPSRGGGGGFDKILSASRKNLSDSPLKALQCSPLPPLAVFFHRLPLGGVEVLQRS